MMSDVKYAVNGEDVLEAAATIRDSVHLTPVVTSEYFNKLSGRSLYFKCENFQKSGSFKARGAVNAVLHLDEASLAAGVVTHSSGNHAQALAYAASAKGISATIVIPEGAPRVKVQAVLERGAEVVSCAPTNAARQATADEIRERTGKTFIHPSEHPHVIAGQGTCGLEMLLQIASLRGYPQPPSFDSSISFQEQLAILSTWAQSFESPILDTAVIPIGGGGLISGIATIIKALDPRIKVLGAEPSGAADAFASKNSRTLQTHITPPVTLADGLKTTLGPNTFPIVCDRVDEIVLVGEAAIRSNTRCVMERMKLVVEPSAVVALSAVLGGAGDHEKAEMDLGQHVGVIICGGNIDFDSISFTH